MKDLGASEGLEGPAVAELEGTQSLGRVSESQSHTSNNHSQRSSCLQPPPGSASLQSTQSGVRGSPSMMYSSSERVLRKCKKTLKSLLALLTSQARRTASRKSKRARSLAYETSVQTSSPLSHPPSQENNDRPSSSSLSRPTHWKHNLWKQEGSVMIMNHEKRELRCTAMILFDTGCEKDIISTDFLAEEFGIVFDDDSELEPLGCSITGREDYVSVGRQSLRWGSPNLKNMYRYEHASCHVVKSDRFDLIIGQQTIDRLNLFQSGITAAFMNVLPGRNASNVTETQRQATQRREQERKDKEKCEKEKKEKQRRDKQQAANSSSSP